MEIFISGYGRMGKMIEGVLQSRGLTCSGKSEDIVSVDKDVAKRSICIDFTTPDAFRANYKFIAENFAAAVVGTTGWYDISGEIFGYFENAIRRSSGVRTSLSESMFFRRLWTWFPNCWPKMADMHRTLWKTSLS